jgi:hypothetical protein
MSEITTTIARMAETMDRQSDTIFELRNELANARKFKVTLMFGGEYPDEVRYTRCIGTARLWSQQAEHYLIELGDNLIEG